MECRLHCRRRGWSFVREQHGVTGAHCRKMEPKVATAPRTQSPLTIKVEIKVKFDSRIKR